LPRREKALAGYDVDVIGDVLDVPSKSERAPRAPPQIHPQPEMGHKVTGDSTRGKTAWSSEAAHWSDRTIHSLPES